MSSKIKGSTSRFKSMHLLVLYTPLINGITWLSLKREDIEESEATKLKI